MTASNRWLLLALALATACGARGRSTVFADASVAPAPVAATASPSPSASPVASATPSAVASHTAAVTLDRGPYLQATTETSVTIVWHTDERTDSLVELGETTGALRTVGDAAASVKRHVVTATGLRPGTKYQYRVTSAGQPVTGFATLATAPASGTPFTFCAFGDSGVGSKKQAEVAALIARTRFDLAVHTGDVIYPSGQASGYDPLFFKPYGAWLRERPIFPAIGNHDYVTAHGKPYLDVFELPANNPAKSELYYSFTWGDALFVSLDTHKAFQDPSGPHVDWLRNELRSSTKRWKIVTMHIPLYSSGEHGSSTRLRNNLQALFEETRVDLVLQGHDHIYERTKPVKSYATDPTWPGVVYVVTGGGGAPRYKVRPHSWTAKAESTRHALFVDVGPTALEGQAIREDGTLIERWRLAK